MALDDFLAKRQADTRSRVRVADVQTLEDHNDLVDDLLGNSDAVVGDA